MPRDEEQAAEDEGRHDLLPTDRVSRAIAARKGDGEQDRARDEVPDRHREKRRKVANHDRERDEGRSPDEVDRSQSKPNPHAVSRSHSFDGARRGTISSSRVSGHLHDSH